jgi:glycosyltransferase involved in cell wall biosynthesis
VSIIIPVYNVEKFLNRCLRSVLGQTYSNIEIILVDDKATDASGSICDDWAKRTDRIKVIHKIKNEGLGFARNTGLESATGDFILFVDSDDYIDKRLCEKSVKRMEETHADICYFGHKKDINGTIVESDLTFLKDEYSGDEIINNFLINTISQNIDQSGAPRIGMSAWRIMYKANVIRDNGLQFYSERDYLNEDLFFRIHLAKCIGKVAVIHENLYYYCFNGASLTMSYRSDRFEASKRMYEKLIEETACFGNNEIRHRCQRAFMNNLLVCIRQEAKCKNVLRHQINKRLKEYCSDPLVKKILSEYPIQKLPIQPRLLYWAIKKNRIVFLKVLVFMKR